MANGRVALRIRPVAIRGLPAAVRCRVAAEFQNQHRHRGQDQAASLPAPRLETIPATLRQSVVSGVFLGLHAPENAVRETRSNKAPVRTAAHQAEGDTQLREIELSSWRV